MAQKQPKTRDELATGYFRMYSTQKQNTEKLAAGELSEEDLWIKAYDKADADILQRARDAEAKASEVAEARQSLEDFRDEREGRYREAYEWNTANDERTLTNILDNEVYTLQISRLLESPILTQPEREKLLDRHSKLVKDHRELLSAAGIDRLSREKKETSSEPMEDWVRVKRQAYDKMEALRKGFSDAADECQTEFDLKNALKYHFGFEFRGIIDKILLTHRRTLGLPEELEDGET